mgnify:CR=1 FL=1
MLVLVITWIWCFITFVIGLVISIIIKAGEFILAAINRFYNAIRKEGTQKSVLDLMQTRADLYEVLDYHAYERKLDQLFAKEKTR